jgi:hypothetical protein
VGLVNCCDRNFQIVVAHHLRATMKGILISSALLCAGAAVAAPGTAARRQGIAGEGLRRTGLPQLLGPEFDSVLVDNNTYAEYTQNWAGAVLIGLKPACCPVVIGELG